MTLTPTQMPPSLWADVTKPGDAYLPLAGVSSADVVIIGAGFTGLSAALHLRRAGASVVVLEAAEPGSGASGCNNGQVIPTLSRADPDQIVARHRVAGERFVGLIRDSAQTLFDIIKAETIDAEAEQTGWVQPVHSPGRMRLAETRAAQWKKAGATVSVLTREGLTRVLGTPAGYYGGLWLPSGGHVNPLALARGLARAVAARGGKIYSNTPAIAYGRAGARWVVTTPEGRCDARALILATNASTDAFSARLAPYIAREMVPVISWQMATQPIPETLRKSILPGREAISDTRGQLRYFRYDARNRLISGGTISGRNQLARLKPLVAQRLIETFPQLAQLPGGLTLDPVGHGTIGVTQDGFPRMHMLGPDGYAWVGCNGRGVALAMAIGREFARGILGVPRSELALPFTEIAPIPLHGLAVRLAPWQMLRAARRDSRELPG